MTRIFSAVPGAASVAVAGSLGSRTPAPTPMKANWPRRSRAWPLMPTPQPHGPFTPAAPRR